MKKKDSSSWSEIKSLDERLARDPDSFCFARLSEIYLKVGLVADALHTARQGVAKHPGYLAGQRALAMACNANGLHEESRTLLEKVTAAVPEDTAAQKLLATLYVDAGDKASAIRAYSTLLDFRPDDQQSKARLEELHGPDSGNVPQVETPAEPAAARDEIYHYAEEDIYELSEDDIVQDEAVEEASVTGVEVVAAPAVAEHHDPLSTLTLAELYEQQGFVAKALDIYRTILADDPANQQLQAKVATLEQLMSDSAPPLEQLETPEIEEGEEAELQVPVAEEEPEQFEETVFGEDVEPLATAESEEPMAPAEATFIEEEPFVATEPPVSAAFEDMASPVEAREFSPLAHKQVDDVVGTLDSWLENIRRIKACR